MTVEGVTNACRERLCAVPTALNVGKIQAGFWRQCSSYAQPRGCCWNFLLCSRGWIVNPNASWRQVSSHTVVFGPLTAMPISKGKFAWIGIGSAVAAAIGSRAALLAEGVALQRLWRTPGFIVAFYVPPWLDSRASKHPWLVFLLWLPFAVDWLILFSAFCALALLVSGGLPIL